jgi:hypothetical protein
MTTNPSKTEAATAAKYAEPARLANIPPISATALAEVTRISDAGAGRATSAFSAMDPRRLDLPVPPGAEKMLNPPTMVTTRDQNGELVLDDLRVRIRVPPWYFTDLTSGYDDDLVKIGGILFPYTPTIGYEYKADYAAQTPMHSNYTLYFYQRSSVGQISISGVFTVENRRDAINYLSTVHLLKSLTKMKFGKDSDAGAPPPICRLDGHGDMMLKNVPVAIINFRVDYTNDVDYFNFPPSDVFGKNSVPTKATIQVNCVPIYSRNELLNFSVQSFVSSRDSSRGFL